MSKAKQKSAILDERQAAKFLGISQSWLRASRSKHPAWAGPPFTKKDGWRIHYEMEDLIAFRKLYTRRTRKIDPAARFSPVGKGAK